MIKINCVGVMGKGVALTCKRKYPKMYSAYKKECRNHRIHIGHMWVWRSKEDGTIIVNFPTKRDWRNPSRLEYISEGLKSFRNILLTVITPDKTIVLPALGCGNGGLVWEEVLTLIKQCLGDLPHDIKVLEPWVEESV
jgi:O-acetyl-ADP-ribose deacetylase (regulator of RNase III)